MKHFSTIALSIIAAWGFATPLLAQSNDAKDTQIEQQVNQISPYELVTASYQGRFVDSGIPSGSRFITATRLHQIDAQDLVQTAISAGRLSEAALEDRSYLSRVDSIIIHLSRT